MPSAATPRPVLPFDAGLRCVKTCMRIELNQQKKGLSDDRRLEITDDAGDVVMIDASSLKHLPRILRNCIAHFNILPLNREGRFDGIRIWNTNDEGLITFVADLRFDDLRPFAKHILESLANSEGHLELDDPIDPMLVQMKQRSAPDRRAPRVVDHVWRKFLAAHGGNAKSAQTAISRLLAKEADMLEAGVPKVDLKAGRRVK
jgi:HEPN pEK499 p136